MNKKEKIAELKAFCLLILMLLATIIYTISIVKIFDYFQTFEFWSASLILVSFISLPLIFGLIEKKKSNIVTKTLMVFFSIPFLVLTILFTIFYPLLFLIIYFGLLMVFIFLPSVMIFKSLDYFEINSFKPEFETYIQFTFATIILLLFNQSLSKWIVFIINVTPNSERWFIDYKYKDLIEYIFNTKNIRFTIYFVYLVFFIYYSYKYVEENNTSLTPKENALMQSFATFLALDQLIPIIKESNLRPSQILKKIKESIKLGYSDKTN